MATPLAAVLVATLCIGVLGVAGPANHTAAVSPSSTLASLPTTGEPNGVYYYQAAISKALESHVRFADGFAAFELFFHYVPHKGRKGEYSSLFYYSSPLIPYVYNTTSKAVQFDIRIGGEFDRHSMMLFGNLYKWTWDYHSRTDKPQEHIRPDLGRDAVYSEDSDSVSMLIFLGFGEFKKVTGQQKDLKTEYEYYRANGDYMNQMILERRPFAEPMHPLRAAQDAKTNGIPQRFVLHAFIAAVTVSGLM